MNVENKTCSVKVYRVWFTDGSGCLVEAHSTQQAGKLALILQTPDLRAELKVARIDKLNV